MTESNIVQLRSSTSRVVIEIGYDEDDTQCRIPIYLVDVVDGAHPDEHVWNGEDYEQARWQACHIAGDRGLQIIERLTA